MSMLKSLFGKKAPKIVEVAPFGASLEMESNQTVLEAALKQGLPFPHNCTVGTCGSCKCKLTEGRVSALSDFGYTLSQQEIQAGYILACQAVPKDPLVRITVEAGAVDAAPPEKFTGTLVRAETLTHDIKKITVELDRPIRFTAGQYANLKVPGIERARNYSFANAPEREGLKSVDFFVRRVPGGQFTEALFSGQLDKATVEFEGPHGHFYLRPNAAAMICIAGGSGLAPLLSLLEHARRTRVKRPCVMLFGARTEADLYGIEQIQSIAGAWQDQFVFLPVLSHEPADSAWKGARGLVTQFIADAIPDIDWANAEGYMCGPPGMIDAGIASMTERGIPLDAIHYDKFTDASHSAAMP